MDDILDDIRDHEDNDKFKDWRIYLGEQANYYIPKWEKIQSGQIITFNIYAFFFGIFWMLYRKMYRTALVIGAIMFVQIIAEESLRVNMNMTEEDFQPITWTFNILFSTCFALFSNLLFFNEAQRRISEVKNSTVANYDIELMEKGGTSLISILVGIIFYVAVFFLVLLIIDPNLSNNL